MILFTEFLTAAWGNWLCNLDLPDLCICFFSLSVGTCCVFPKAASLDIETDTKIPERQASRGIRGMLPHNYDIGGALDSVSSFSPRCTDESSRVRSQTQKGKQNMPAGGQAKAAFQFTVSEYNGRTCLCMESRVWLYRGGYKQICSEACWSWSIFFNCQDHDTSSERDLIKEIGDIRCHMNEAEQVWHVQVTWPLDPEVKVQHLS